MDTVAVLPESGALTRASITTRVPLETIGSERDMVAAGVPLVVAVVDISSAPSVVIRTGRYSTDDSSDPLGSNVTSARSRRTSPGRKGAELHDLSVVLRWRCDGERIGTAVVGASVVINVVAGAAVDAPGTDAVGVVGDDGPEVAGGAPGGTAVAGTVADGGEPIGGAAVEAVPGGDGVGGELTPPVGAAVGGAGVAGIGSDNVAVVLCVREFVSAGVAVAEAEWDNVASCVGVGRPSSR